MLIDSRPLDTGNDRNGDLLGRRRRLLASDQECLHNDVLHRCSTDRQLYQHFRNHRFLQIDTFYFFFFSTTAQCNFQRTNFLRHRDTNSSPFGTIRLNTCRVADDKSTLVENKENSDSFRINAHNFEINAKRHQVFLYGIRFQVLIIRL